jgi:hypothetical protein
MNHREPPHPSAAARKVLLCFVLLLWTALTPLGAQAAVRGHPVTTSAPGVGSLPYLLAAGPLPLRFQPAPPPPMEASERPAGPSAGSSPGSNPETIDPSADAPAAPPRVDTPVAAAASPEAGTEAKPAAPVRTFPPILPDNAQPAVRPEDFIKYFQLPGSGRNSPDVTVIVPAPPAPPAPGTLPPSSATYRQTP